MNELIALSTIRRASRSEAMSALPGAPVVEGSTSPTLLRRVTAVALRATAEREHRWADRLDPAAHRPATAGHAVGSY